MAWDLAYTIYYGDLTGFTDITSSVEGFSHSLEAPIGEFGRSRATLTINNADGAFTPGGTGTYSSVDWFTKVILIEATLNGTTVPVFSGIVDDLSIERTSIRESTFTLIAVDAITIAGRSQVDAPYVTDAYFTDDAISRVINGDVRGSTVYLEEVAFPTFESNTETKADVISSMIGASNPDRLSVIYSSYFTTGTVAGTINDTIMPSGPEVGWCSDLYTVAQPQMRFNILCLDYPLSRADSNAWFFEFRVEGSGISSTYELPVVAFDEAFTKDQLSNSCNVARSDGTYPRSNNDLGSQNQYGIRNKSFTNLANYNPDFSDPTQRIADFWVNRFSTIRYQIRTLTTSYKTALDNDAGNSEDDFRDLLSISKGVWQEVRCYTGSGASLTTTKYMILGRTINATPTDTTITLILGWFYDNSSIVLGTDTIPAPRTGTYNELGGNGYDESTLTYDSPNNDYNRGPLTGSRLA